MKVHAMRATAPMIPSGLTDAENEFPCQVRAVTDLANNCSPEHFRFAVGHCRDVIAKVIAEDNRSDQQIARVRILKLVDLQLSRAVRWVEDDADLMAGVLRSLIELKFWAKFVSESEEKATQFINESNIDLREVSERLRRLMPDDDETMPPLPPNSDGKRVDVRPSGDQEELTWKMASKLIHPSSHVINEFENAMNDPPKNQFFALQILVYGWGIITIFHDIVWTA